MCDTQLNRTRKVILHYVAQKPCTGYDICKQVNDVGQGLHLKIDHQFVYRQANAMRKEGLLNVDVVPQDGKPDRRVYALTDAGAKLYADVQASVPVDLDLPFTNHATVHALMGNVEYFGAMYTKAYEETEKLFIEKVEAAGNPLKEIMLDRKILLIHAEFEFAKKMIQFLTPGNQPYSQGN